MAESSPRRSLPIAPPGTQTELRYRDADGQWREVAEDLLIKCGNAYLSCSDTTRQGVSLFARVQRLEERLEKLASAVERNERYERYEPAEALNEAAIVLQSMRDVLDGEGQQDLARAIKTLLQAADRLK